MRGMHGTRGMRGTCGTRAAAERAAQEKCDLYSIGVTFMKLVIGSRPGDEEKEVGLLDQSLA